MEGNVVEAIRSIRPCIEEHRVWASENARMAPEVVEATRKAGLYTLMAPREVGGADATYPEVMDVFLELGYSDPTVAWHGINSAYLTFAVASVAEDLRDPIFAGPSGPYGFAGDPRATSATIVDDGYRLNGTWPFMTGSLDVTWSLARAIVMDGGSPRMLNGAPEVRAFILPASDYEVRQTWGAAVAMRGTGSHGISMEDVFVPGGLSVPVFGSKEPVTKSRATRLPNAAVMLAPTAAMAVGLAKRVLEEATNIAVEKAIAGKPYRELPDRQFTIATGNAVVAGLEATVRNMAHEVESNLGDNPGEVAPKVRALMWSTTYWVLDQSRAVVSDLAAISTSSFYARQNPIEMALRDVQAICASLGDFRSQFARAAGRVYLGLEPDSPIF